MGILRSLSVQEFARVIFIGLYSPATDSKSALLCPRNGEIVLVLNGSNMEEQDFRGLTLAAEAYGDRQIIIADAETNEPSEAAVLIDASFSSFEAAKSRPGTRLAILDLHLFGQSGNWGGICVASLDDVALLGGDSRFVARFVAAAGGMAVLRDRFLEFATTEWSIGEEARSHLLAMVGW